ncbi:hypothetical protein KUCAC02_013811 [Chaenocephalus aceratus]|uniref:Uncharacterized protein n=1 Tax=Chaenocephalus aceratus TaxID=36190 RepID=A0ACB9WDA4_CHAAC|nr:hypothetical protein KUCAC02_013811 [Chaenocephalus aceratus]
MLCCHQCSKPEYYTLARQFSDPHGLYLHWPVPIRCGPEMEQERKEDAQHPKAIFCEALQSAYGRSGSHGSMCRDVSPQTQKQMVVHQSVLLPLGCDHCECLAPIQHVWSGTDGSSALQGICSWCAHKCRIHQDTRKRKTQCKSKAPPEIRFGSGNHWPQLTEANNANRCQDAACTRRTKYIGMQCRVALCPGCFANYHGR